MSRFPGEFSTDIQLHRVGSFLYLLSGSLDFYVAVAKKHHVNQE